MGCRRNLDFESGCFPFTGYRVENTANTAVIYIYAYVTKSLNCSCSIVFGFMGSHGVACMFFASLHHMLPFVTA